MAQVLNFDPAFQAKNTQLLCRQYDSTANKWVKYIPAAYDWSRWLIKRFCNSIPDKIIYRGLDRIANLEEKNSYHYCLFPSPSGEMLVSRVWDPKSSQANYDYVVNGKEIRELYPEIYVKCVKQGVMDYLERNLPMTYQHIN